MAFNVETARQSVQVIVEQRVEAQWISGGMPRTPIQFPDVLGLRDVNGQTIDQPPADSPWLKLDLIWGNSLEATFGTIALNENAALIQLSVYVPRNRGDGQLNQLLGYAAKIFDRFHSLNSGIRCRASSSGPPISGGGYLLGIVRTPFTFYTEAGNQF